MAQNITLQGASYSDVPSVLLPKTGGGTASFTDVTDTTAVASDVAAGKYFYLANGTKTEGTGTGGGGGIPSVTQDQDGYLVLDDEPGTEATKFLITLTLDPITTYWQPDKTYAQIVAAQNAGDIFVLDAFNSEPCETFYSYVNNVFGYKVAWFDYYSIVSQDFYQYTDSYEYTSNGLVLYDRQATAYPLTTIAKTITANGTYDPWTDDGVDAYSSVTVNVSGGGGSVEPKQINFIDYDGTLVASKTKAEINAMTSDSDLPANPSHTGLTAQGWNWTVAQLKAQLLAQPDDTIWVGQMYITSSGDTEIDVSMPYGRLDPILTIAVNGTVTVDWGDNTTADTVTGSSLTTRQAVPHTYASEGDYTIVIHVTSGSFTFYGSTSYLVLRKNASGNENRVYANCVQSMRLGSGITSIGTYAFYYCYSLASITIPSGVTSIGTYAFYYCSSLASITIPSSVTSIGSSTFYNCYSLTSVTIPSGVTSIDGSAFYSCFSLASITIPSGVTSIGNSSFASCPSFASIIIPSSVTSIGSSTFYNCFSLASITIPSEVTSIDGSAFSNCYGMKEYHILPTDVPTLGTSAFANISSDCVIYVPTAKLNDYKTASNWSTYASYMQGE